MKLCECGCGGVAPIATKTFASEGIMKGQPRGYIQGHHLRSHLRLPIGERFWMKVRRDGECLIWIGAKAKGYGVFSNEDGRQVPAHVWIYEKMIGPVPHGLELDHLCRRRACVNWNHVEPVTHRVNLLRGESPAAKHAIKTHCPKGHLYDERNTGWTKKRTRVCRECRRIAANEAYRVKTGKV